MKTGNTRERLLQHAERYPLAETRDYLKFLYQSAFGCEHLVTDASAAASFLRQEAEKSPVHTGNMLEPLDGPYCRVSLDILKSGLAAETLAKLFVLSAEHHEDGNQLLEEKLTVLHDLLSEGALPLDHMQTEADIDAWRESGYPAIHHSEAFRREYAPAYRVIKAAYANYLPLLAEIDRRLRKEGPVFVAVDGCCAGGKTTLADLLARIYSCNVFHMDDFFLRPEQRTPERYAEPGGNVDRERFLAEVLTHLKKGETVRYRRFDCHTLSLLPAVDCPPTRLSVVEGSYSLHPALRNQYSLRVFLKTDPEEQARRILIRNGEESAKVFAKRWIPLEERYFDACRPEESADFVFHT